MAIIEVDGLVKDFRKNSKDSGIKGALKNIIKPDKSIFRAVDGISFKVNEGEIVGYIGPNGAGKSTTIKMMCGILQPTSGKVLINSVSPYENRKEVVRQIGVVFGQRTQLYWDLRLGESFELLRRIYQINDETYNSNMEILNDILSIDEIINTPVRQLSLGQRMRGDLAAAILHSPPLMFLDEPTIGLDVEVKHSVRKFIKDINEKYKTTIILTTHDLDDIEQLCDRIMIINKGVIVEDGSLNQLMERLAPTKRLVVDFLEIPVGKIDVENAVVVKQDQARVWFEYDKKTTCAGDVLKQISSNFSVRDINLEETSIDDVIRRVYAETE